MGGGLVFILDNNCIYYLSTPVVCMEFNVNTHTYTHTHTHLDEVHFPLLSEFVSPVKERPNIILYFL